MQGQRSSEHGSTSNDAGIDSHVLWTNMQTSVENPLPEYRIPSAEINSPYLHHVEPVGLNGEWSFSESSSRSQAHQSGRKREHEHQIANGASVLQISRSNVLPQDLNMCSEFRDSDDDECQIVVHPNTHISVRSSNEKLPFTGIEDSDHGPGSLDGQRISCKRKASEVHVGQSSRAGSSNCFEYAERNASNISMASQDEHNVDFSNETEQANSDYGLGCSLDGRQISCKRKASEVHVGQSSRAENLNRFEHAERIASNVSMSSQADRNVDFSNETEQANSGIRLGIGRPVSPNPVSSSARGTAENSRRNFRLRISASHQLDHVSSIPFPTEANVGNPDVSSSRHSSRLLRNCFYDLNRTPASGNRGGHHSQSVLSHVPSLRGNPQSRWGGASSSRTSNASASAISLERATDAMLFEESAPGSIPRSISEHPMFVPAGEIGSSSQLPTNWNNVASTSPVGSASGVNSSSPTGSHRSYPHYPRRLPEIVQRSLLSSVGSESRGQSNNLVIRSSSSGASQEMALSSGSVNRGHHLPTSRSALLDRHLDGALRVPLLRSLAASGEGRSSIMSEQIRHVLDLMRRGEGLRVEDMMMLDHSVFFGMGNPFDRHRDMRMDVDNMSYEELLALEERIGNVCTGLNEETIMNRLKQQKYCNRRATDEANTEPCSICREEYNKGEDVGILECGHDFHRDCIKQWLMHKNLCPICKTTGLTK